MIHMFETLKRRRIWPFRNLHTPIEIRRKKREFSHRGENTHTIISAQSTPKRIRHNARLEKFTNGEFENWVACRQLLQSGEAIYKSLPVPLKSLDMWAKTATNIAWYQWRQGNYDVAEEMATQALSVRQVVSGWCDISTLVCAEVLAGVLSSKGKSAEALELNRRSLQGFKKLKGSSHRYTLTSMSNTALVLQKMGAYKESEELNHAVFKESLTSLGVYHTETLISANNLALVLQHQNKYRESEKLHRYALAGFRETLGPDHPHTLESLSNLACTLRSRGEHNESIDLTRQSLEAKIEVLGSMHPSTLDTAGKLALMLEATKDHERVNGASAR